MNTPWILYVLRLEGGNYYVGKTTNFRGAMHQHRTAAYADAHFRAWTTLHRPVDGEDAIEEKRVMDGEVGTEETNLTLKYMARHGMERVRGGVYCRAVLSEADLAAITMQLKGAGDKCYSCDGPGHFARDCQSRAPPSPAPSSARMDTSTPTPRTRPPSRGTRAATPTTTRPGACFRCGGQGHWAANCTAKDGDPDD
jgi:hypothetical protein